MDSVDDTFLFKIMDRVYPVGALYWNATDGTDPNITLGFGTWTQITDKVIMAAGSTYSAGATGGAANHSHGLSAGYARVAISNPGPGFESVGVVPSWTETHVYNSTRSNSSSSRTGGTGLGGSTDGESNLPPYEVSYCWKRTA